MTIVFDDNCIVLDDNKSSAVVHRSRCILCFTPKALFSSVLDTAKQERSHLQSHIFVKDTSALVFNNFQLSCSLVIVCKCFPRQELIIFSRRYEWITG